MNLTVNYSLLRFYPLNYNGTVKIYLREGQLAKFVHLHLNFLTNIFLQLLFNYSIVFFYIKDLGGVRGMDPKAQHTRVHKSIFLFIIDTCSITSCSKLTPPQPQPNHLPVSDVSWPFKLRTLIFIPNRNNTYEFPLYRLIWRTSWRTLRHSLSETVGKK